MNDLIEALTIFSKYSNERHPTHCEHDILMVVGVELSDVSEEDISRLDKLSFTWCDEYDVFKSYRFGSA